MEENLDYLEEVITLEEDEDLTGRDLLRKEMADAVSSNSAIGEEYQSTFSEEERITSILNLRSDSFSLEMERLVFWRYLLQFL